MKVRAGVVRGHGLDEAFPASVVVEQAQRVPRSLEPVVEGDRRALPEGAGERAGAAQARQLPHPRPGDDLPAACHPPRRVQLALVLQTKVPFRPPTAPVTRSTPQKLAEPSARKVCRNVAVALPTMSPSNASSTWICTSCGPSPGVSGGHGIQRHAELRRRIEGISERMLTQTLRELERNGMVTRTDHGVLPPRVDYALTPLGSTLQHTITQLCGWVLDHMDEVRAAQAAYDDARPRHAAPRQEARESSRRRPA